MLGPRLVAGFGVAIANGWSKRLSVTELPLQNRPAYLGHSSLSEANEKECLVGVDAKPCDIHCALCWIAPCSNR